MTNRLLAIKIGNSNLGVGIFEGADLVATWRAYAELKTADEYAILLDEFFAPLHLSASSTGAVWSGVALVSVVPALTTIFQELCRRYFEIDPLVVGSRVKTGMPIRYDDPRTLGTDRLVVAVAAKARYGAPLIVIDFGTATTFNTVNRAGDYVGGAIAPGLNLAVDALHQSTAQLPRVDLVMPPDAIARNTIHAMQSGILLGYVGMVEGMVARMRSELGEPNAHVIATGGLAEILAPVTRVIDRVDRDLIFHGLRIIFEMNISSQ